MKYSFTLLLLITISLQQISAQHLVMANSFTKPEMQIRNGRPQKITEVYTSRLFNSKFIIRKEAVYNWPERLIRFSAHDKKGLLVHSYETRLDSSLQKVLFMVNINYKNKPDQEFRDTMWLSYNDRGSLTCLVASYDGKQRTALFTTDAEGYAVEAKVISNHGEIAELEKAVYHPEENYYVISRSSGRPGGKIISDTHRLEQGKFSSPLDEKMLFNEQGDMIYEKRKGSKNRPGPAYEYEYEYDDRGNWIRKTSYIFDGKSGKRKRINRSEREIVYGDGTLKTVGY